MRLAAPCCWSYFDFVVILWRGVVHLFRCCQTCHLHSFITVTQFLANSLQSECSYVVLLQDYNWMTCFSRRQSLPVTVNAVRIYIYIYIYIYIAFLENTWLKYNITILTKQEAICRFSALFLTRIVPCKWWLLVEVSFMKHNYTYS